MLLKLKDLFKKDRKRMKPIEMIKKVTLNINKIKTEKYNIEPEEVERTLYLMTFLGKSLSFIG